MCTNAEGLVHDFADDITRGGLLRHRQLIQQKNLPLAKLKEPIKEFNVTFFNTVLGDVWCK